MPEVPPPGEEFDFDQWFWDMVCEIYRGLDGDCADLGPRPEKRADQLNDKSLAGLPSFPNEQAEEDFFKLIDWLEEGLKRPENNLPPATTAMLDAMIARLRAERT
jgi:hypothetical protein